jgi:hypothetical protein
MQARLGDFWLPQRGLFIIGHVFMEQFDPARHRDAVSWMHPQQLV